jgi:Sec-independent protein translocase protein TatA
MPPEGEQLPGRGLLGWLGRQIGHVKKAISTDVQKQQVYRNASVQEKEHPSDPNITLRRTTIDEAIVNRDED